MKSNLPDLEKEILNEVQPSTTEQHQLKTCLKAPKSVLSKCIRGIVADSIAFI